MFENETITILKKFDPCIKILISFSFSVDKVSKSFNNYLQEINSFFPKKVIFFFSPLSIRGENVINKI